MELVTPRRPAEPDRLMTPTQAEHLRDWKSTADVQAFGVLDGTLHVLVRISAAHGRRHHWTDRVVFANGLVFSQPVDSPAWYGAPDPLRPVRNLVRKIEAAGGTLAPDLLDQLKPDPAPVIA